MNKLLIPIILILCSLSWSTVCPTTGYQYVVSLTVAAQGSTTTDMTRFPAVYIGNTNWKTVGNGGFLQSSTGIDVIFCDGPTGGNLLPYELVTGTYTPTTGAGEWWIQMPTISHTTSSVIYAFFDHTSPTDFSSPASVWQNVTVSNINASLIMHYGTSSTLTLTDSTGVNTVTNSGAAAVAGEINGAASFITGTAFLDAGAVINIAQQTITAWQLPHPGGSISAVGINVIATNTNTTSSASGYGMYTFNGGITYFINNGSSQSGVRYTNITDHGGTFKYWAGTYNGGTANSASSYTMYENGVLEASTTTFGSITSMGTPTNHLLVAQPVSGQDNDNYLDELHIWPVVLTGDWILDEYNNINAPATFFTTGSFTPVGGSNTQPWFGPLN